jgi:hypothetical protein
MSKYYLSRSITRAMSADHPIGDPTGGAAYGEKNDPISAGISLFAMGSTYAAAGSFAAMTVMQGITFAGAALSLVGNITGNKTLSKIGMVAGVVGGLGQMGAFGEAAKGATFTGGAQTGAAGVPASGPAQQLAQTPVKPVVPPSATLADDLASAQQSAAAARAQLAPSGGSISGATAQRGAAGYAGINAPSGNVVNTASGAGNITPNVATNGSSYTGNYVPSNIVEATKDAGYGAAVNPFSSVWQDTKDILGAPLEFAKDNPYGAMAVGQIAQPIAEYLSGKTDAEIEALEAQTRANEANAGFADARTEQLKEEIAREKMRRRNLNAGYMNVNAGFTVNPNASMTQQGLIAQNMQPAG